MTLGITLAAVATAVLLYALWGRAWLKTKPWAQGFFAAVEPIEIALFKKSETILWARLKMAVGLLLSVLTTLGQIDLTPIMPFVPAKYETIVRAAFNLLPLTITIVGYLDEQLRKSVTKPLELVAIPDKAITPRVAEAMAMADATKDEAVAVIKEAGAA